MGTQIEELSSSSSENWELQPRLPRTSRQRHPVAQQSPPLQPQAAYHNDHDQYGNSNSDTTTNDNDIGDNVVDYFPQHLPLDVISGRPQGGDGADDDGGTSSSVSTVSFYPALVVDQPYDPRQDEPQHYYYEQQQQRHNHHHPDLSTLQPSSPPVEILQYNERCFAGRASLSLQQQQQQHPPHAMDRPPLQFCNNASADDDISDLPIGSHTHNILTYPPSHSHYNHDARRRPIVCLGLIALTVVAVFAFGITFVVTKDHRPRQQRLSSPPHGSANGDDDDAARAGPTTTTNTNPTASSPLAGPLTFATDDAVTPVDLVGKMDDGDTERGAKPVVTTYAPTSSSTRSPFWVVSPNPATPTPSLPPTTKSPSDAPSIAPTMDNDVEQLRYTFHAVTIGSSVRAESPPPLTSPKCSNATTNNNKRIPPPVKVTISCIHPDDGGAKEDSTAPPARLQVLSNDNEMTCVPAGNDPSLVTCTTVIDNDDDGTMVLDTILVSCASLEQDDDGVPASSAVAVELELEEEMSFVVEDECVTATTRTSFLNLGRFCGPDPDEEDDEDVGAAWTFDQDYYDCVEGERLMIDGHGNIWNGPAPTPEGDNRRILRSNIIMFDAVSPSTNEIESYCYSIHNATTPTSSSSSGNPSIRMQDDDSRTSSCSSTREEAPSVLEMSTTVSDTISPATLLILLGINS